MERIKSTAICLVSLMIGLGLLSTGLSGFGEAPANSVAVILLGLLMLTAAVVFFALLVLPAWRDGSRTAREDFADIVKADQTGNEDSDAADELLTSFREAMRDYFSADGLPENSPVQSVATQLYWHILYLQKRRMEQKSITLEFSAQRKRYGGVSVTKRQYFDGKYNMIDARERISATRIYSRNGKRLLRKTDEELAHYGILNAKPVSGGSAIICPSCGSETTRENLLDGCDYCGTRFAVEDLGARISSFALRQDYQISYDKYRDERKYYGNRAFLAGAIPTALISVIGFLSVMDELDAGPVMGLVALFFGTVFLASSAGLFAMYVFWVTLFPVIQARKTVAYYTKKRLAERKTAESWTDRVVELVHGFDPLFSLEGFLSSVQNKLAAIHYAESADEVKAFAEAPLKPYLEGYQDVVDMDVTEISLLNYRADDRMQFLELRAILELTVAADSEVSRRAETLLLSLEKSSACKTEAVCGPSVLRCRSCGASLSLLDGGKCAYCGRELNLREYDWVITAYRVQS